MVKDKLTSVLADLQEALTDADKFDGGNASAGVRLRKQAQAVVRVLKEVRKAVSDTKAQRKAEKPAKVDETPATPAV